MYLAISKRNGKGVWHFRSNITSSTLRLIVFPLVATILPGSNRGN